MTETTEQGQATASANGTAPTTGQPAEGEPCVDCVTGGEKALAILAGLFAAFLIGMAIDMFTGGKLTGFVREQAGAPGD